MNWSLLPHFTKPQTGTSYELLAAVRKAILEEPKRVNMTGWLHKQTDYVDGVVPTPYGVREFPACGTQGCIAGWMTILTAPTSELVRSDVVPFAAYRLFPNSLQKEAALLFHGEHPRVDGYIDYDTPVPYPFPTSLSGTPEYAKAVAANITRFMRKHKKALQAHKLNAKQVFKNYQEQNA